MNAINTFVLLMFIAVLLVGIAQKMRISYPIALVLGGAVLGFTSGLTPIEIDPTNLLVIVLPPILFYGSYNLSFKEFVRYLGDIFSLAIGLVIVTTLVVAFLFKWLFPELSWPLAFAFGALISPPDAVAATMILRRFDITSRLKTILEGESLINDASGLVIYKFAVLALMTGSFSLKTTIFHGFYMVAGGITLGLILGYLLNKSSTFLNPVLSVVYSFIMPYIAYCLADYLNMSGVLAVVACGLIGARMLLTHFKPVTRVLGWASWDILIILLNCFIFILIGLEFQLITKEMSSQELWLYSEYGILITLVIIATRFMWIYIRRGFWHLMVLNDANKVLLSRTYMRHALISGWAGMRGIVSLTAALALPFTLPNGTPLAGREIVIFLTFEIIFLTLVIPGLTLPLLIKWLGIHSHLSNKELLEARKTLTEIAFKEIHKFHSSKHLNDKEMQLLKMYFHSRHEILHISSISEEHKVEQARHQIVQKQRDYLMTMWVNNKVDDALMTQLERELDLEESHLARGDIS